MSKKNRPLKAVLIICSVISPLFFTMKYFMQYLEICLISSRAILSSHWRGFRRIGGGWGGSPVGMPGDGDCWREGNQTRRVTQSINNNNNRAITTLVLDLQEPDTRQVTPDSPLGPTSV